MLTPFEMPLPLMIPISGFVFLVCQVLKFCLLFGYQ